MSTETTLKSYLDPVEREGLMRRSGMNMVYLCESQEADNAGDTEASWAWLAKAVLPAHTLLRLKERRGAQFIRDLGFPTTKADAAYGKDWLDR